MTMTDERLDAIEERSDKAISISTRWPSYGSWIQESVADVPALIAEVERLKALLAEEWRDFQKACFPKDK